MTQGNTLPKQRKSSESAKNSLPDEVSGKHVNTVSVRFGINDCPVWLYKQFMHDVKQKYNNVYWTKLMDIVRKAEAYDLVRVEQQTPLGQEDIELVTNEEEENVDEGVQTMGGFIPYNNGDDGK